MLASLGAMFASLGISYIIIWLGFLASAVLVACIICFLFERCFNWLNQFRL